MNIIGCVKGPVCLEWDSVSKIFKNLSNQTEIQLALKPIYSAYAILQLLRRHFISGIAAICTILYKFHNGKTGKQWQ